MGERLRWDFFRLFFSLWEEIFCVACGVVLVCSRGALGDIIIITPTFRWIFRWILFFSPFSLFFSFPLSSLRFRILFPLFFLVYPPLSPISLYFIPTDVPSIIRLAHFAAATALAPTTHSRNYLFLFVALWFFRFVCR